MSLGIKKNDTVLVTAGKDKGKRGRILRVDRDADRVTVEKVNMIKRHSRPSRTHQHGGIIEKEAPIHRSNLMLICPKCDKPTRIATAMFDGAKARACKKCKEVMDT